MKFRAEAIGRCILMIFSASLATGQSSGNCSIRPIQLPLRNVTLPDGIAGNRGISVSLGNQEVGLRLTTRFSNLRVRNSLDCEKPTAFDSVGCQGASGSSFDIGPTSGDFQEARASQWNGTTDDELPDDAPTYGWVTATFDDGLTIPGFPIESYHEIEGRNRSGLSIKQKSSVFRTLIHGNHIPSTVFGLFFGSRSQTRGVDGSLTLGGYDKARVDGPFTNFTISEPDKTLPCPLKADVRDIRIGYQNGSSFSLFGEFSSPTSSYKACIDPLQNQFNVPPGMYSRFAVLTGHPSDFQEQIYPMENEVLVWNLSVTLHNGQEIYDTVIPHYEFVSQQRGTGIDGKYRVINESRIQVALGTTSDNETAPVLGGVFLAMNYLFVDYEAKVFSLAPAVIGELPELKPEVVSVCVPSENATAETPSGKRSNNQIGAIAGGVVVGGVVLIALVAFFCFRRRKPNVEPMPSDWRESTKGVRSDYGDLFVGLTAK